MKDKMMDVENVGIMQGFLDDLGEEEALLEAEESTDDSVAARILDRRPGSPEILMNNLRGDMRSVEARREELADLVGYEAAAETPEAVLAMLQPVLAQGGLGALPQSGDMAQGPQPPMMPPPPGGEMMGGPPPGEMPPGAPPLPPEAAPMPAGAEMAAPPGAGLPPGGGMAPGGPPPEMMIGPDGQPIPPEGLPPIQMRDGGFVQRFRDGSPNPDDEDEETQKNLSGGGIYSPELVALAQERMMNFLSAERAPPVDIRKTAAEREKLYQDLLGSDKDSRQAQLLFSLAQKGLQFAGNVDAQGRPLRGSTASRFATVASELPGEINKFISDDDKQRRSIRMAAIQAAEKEAESAREGNIKQIESERKFFSDILRNSRQGSSTFGKGGLGPFWNIVTAPGMVQAYADGQLTPEEDNMFVAGANQIIAAGRDRVVRSFDELGRPIETTVPGYQIPWLEEALAKRQQLDAQGGPRPTPPPPTVPLGPTVVDSREPASTPPLGPTVAEPGESAPSIGPSPPTSSREPEIRTLWERAPSIATVDFAGASVGQNIPGAGRIFSEAQQDLNYYNSMVRDLTRALAANPRFPVAELTQIRRDLNLDPSIRRDATSLRNAFIGVNDYLTVKKADALRAYEDENNTPELRSASLNSAVLIEDFQRVLMPPMVRSPEELRALPIGTKFLGWDPETNYWRVDTRKRLLDE